MKSRPWPLVVLAFLQIISPLFSIAVSAHLSHMSWFEYTREMWAGTWLQRFDFFFLMPIAGLAILRPRRWSYPVFLSATLWVTLENLHEWQMHPQAIPSWLILAVSIVDIALVSYFLLPTVRAVYFDRTLRWWETCPRFRIDLDCTIRLVDGTVSQAKIANLSRGGVFLRTQAPLATGNVRELSFEAFGHKIRVMGLVVHAREGIEEGDGGGFGVRFQHTPETEKALDALTRLLDEKALPRWPEKYSLAARLDEFKSWLVRLVRTGKGWLPERK